MRTADQWAGGFARWALPLLVVITGCAGAESTSTQPAPTPPATSAQTPTAAIAPGEASAAPATGASSGGDAVDLLADAIVATGDVYGFESIVTVDDAVVSRASGRVNGAAQAVAVETGDAVVEYVKTADGEWAKGPDDDDWVPVGDAGVFADLLEVLREPRRATITSDDGGTVKISAEYAGSALGADAETVTLRITLRDGLISRVRYVMSIAGSPAEVDTLIGDVGAVDPIVAPGG